LIPATRHPLLLPLRLPAWRSGGLIGIYAFLFAGTAEEQNGPDKNYYCYY
jgi:hypothetical protein